MTRSSKAPTDAIFRAYDEYIEILKEIIKLQEKAIEKTFPLLAEQEKMIEFERERNAEDRQRMAIRSTGLRIRSFVFKRDNHKCVRCGSTLNLELDHIRPIKDGGNSEIDNLQTLCRSCHLDKNKEDAKRRKETKIEMLEKGRV